MTDLTPEPPSDDVGDAYVLGYAKARGAYDVVPLWCRPKVTAEELAELIWTTSRADESTISATGANHVSAAILARYEVRRKP